MAQGHKNIAEMRLTAGIARQRINKIAQNSGHVILGNHAREQMLNRDFLDIDVYRVLRLGYVDDQPEKTDHDGEWKCKVTLKIRGGRTAGVVTIILQNGKLFVKTVEWEDLT